MTLASLRPLHIVAALSAALGVTPSGTPAKPPVSAGADNGPLTELPYIPALSVDYMDKTVDPCNDLYQYSCGGWLKNNPIPPDQSSWSVYAKLAKDNERLLWGLAEEASQG